MQKGMTGYKLHYGKQTLWKLMKHNTGVSNIEITDQNIRAFSTNVMKYGIDFTLKKDTSGEIPCYLVFFKGWDADVITAAFRKEPGEREKAFHPQETGSGEAAGQNPAPPTREGRGQRLEC